METLSIDLTDEQMEILHPLCIGVEEGGAVFAQVYADSVMRVQVISAETARTVQEAIGISTPGDLRRYGRDA